MNKTIHSSHLIIMGNRNEDTFANTLRGVAQHWKTQPVSDVHLFRVPSGSDEILPDWLNLCSKLLPENPNYHQYVIADITEVATQLPRLLDTLLAKQRINPEAIIVDMTNGTKTWCDFVFLTCTLMHITNLFRVRIPRDMLTKPWRDVDAEFVQLDFEPMLKHQDLQRLVRSTYSEYIFYLDETNRFVHWLATDSCFVVDSTKFYERLLLAFEHYMRDHYSDCIITSATLLEEFLDQLFVILERKFGNYWATLVNHHFPGNSLGSKAHTLGQACTRINYLVSKMENGFTNSSEGQALMGMPATFQFAPIISIGTHCQALAIIRNYSGHGNPFSSALQTETDARKMLHGLLYVLGKVRVCLLFSKDV